MQFQTVHMLSSLSKLIFCFTLHTSLNDDNDFPKKLNYCVASRFRDNADLQLRLLYISAPQFFGCWANSRSYQRPRAGLLQVLEKTKQTKTKKHAYHHTRLYTGIAIYFIFSETSLQCGL